MAGHTPIRLMLTSSPLRTSSALQALLGTLRRDFLANLRQARKAERGHMLHSWGRLVIGGNDISIEVDFLPDPSQAGLVYPVILLHSEAYEAAFDLLRRRVRPRGKQALIEFCIAAAASVHAEGFRLEFAGDEQVSPLTTESLITGLTSDKFNGLVGGIAISSPSLGMVKMSWPLASERNGYFIVDFI
jgi:hypothetical protein